MNPLFSSESLQHLQRLRSSDPAFDEWATGRGIMQHRADTQLRWHAMASIGYPHLPRGDALWSMLGAADHLARMGMWLVVHMTYARNVYLDGRPLTTEDFKDDPEGHTGGALNMVPAYVGYLLANALSNKTRAWTMGQGHCVAAIDAVNLLVGNALPAHSQRYPLDDTGLTRMVRDFYSYALRPDGRPESPLGSHVNVNTAGGISEGGYLGFTALQYVHMPLPGQSLVAFLSDGAFEEQRGSDWSARWWRAEDSGHVAPIMIANGRRIDQRTTVAQSGGVEWLERHLQLNGFDPMVIDGRDPAAFAWAILEMEQRLDTATQRLQTGEQHYPVALPYAIAETEKGWGFPGAGSNAAHNLPLGANPARDHGARELFNHGAGALHVTLSTLRAAVAQLNNHGADRSREREHPLARFQLDAPRIPALPWHAEPRTASAMAAIDAAFSEIATANPLLRARVGNPDEMRSNRMNMTLDQLKHRVTHPEPGVAEALDGKVITALNEEAVACAALGNKQGLNLIVSYEAFAVKMLGVLRQEIIFSRHQREVGRTPEWLSVPLLLTSHTWENGKNEQSHQDPTLIEALLTEMSDTARVLFPADWNSAIATLVNAYQRRGCIAAMVVPKRELAGVFSPDQAVRLAADGYLCLHHDEPAQVQLIAVGAYQLWECRRAARRLTQQGVPHSLVYVLEPGRLRQPRDRLETDYTVAGEALPPSAPARVIVSHSHAETMLGVLRTLDLGPARSRGLGYRNQGGTLDVFGMLFANHCTWAHILDAAAACCDIDPGAWLTSAELQAIRGQGEPRLLDADPA